MTLTVAVRPVVVQSMPHFLIDGAHRLHVGFAPLPTQVLGLNRMSIETSGDLALASKRDSSFPLREHLLNNSWTDLHLEQLEDVELHHGLLHLERPLQDRR